MAGEPWTPELKRWTSFQITKNMWRFDPMYEHDDLMQEALIKFYKLKTKYPDVEKVSHFNALYKTSINNLIIDKARERRKRLADTRIDDVLEDQLPESALSNFGATAIILQEMPDELKAAVHLLTSGRVRLKLDRPTKKLRSRENHNARLKRRLGLDDAVGTLKAYLTS